MTSCIVDFSVVKRFFQVNDLIVNADETLDEIRGVTVVQKKNGYRFSMDSILLADFVDLAGTKTAVDLGTGNGIAAILLAGRSKELKVVGVELQDTLYRLAVRNVGISSLSDRIEVVKADIKGLKGRLDGNRFDLVVSNPPYYRVGKGRISPEKERGLARHEVAVTMEELIGASVFLLKGNGRLALIYPDERLDEVTSTMGRFGIGPRRLRRVHAKKGPLAMVEGEKGYRGGILEEPQLLL